MAALHGGDRQGRFDATLELARLGDQRAIPSLLDRLWVELAAPEADWVVIAAIARVALQRRLRYADLVADLVAVVEAGDWTRWSSGRSSHLAPRAFALLAKLGPAGVAAVIALLERTPHAALRRAAATALRHRGRAVPVLIATVDQGEEDDAVRAAAASSLGDTRAREAVPALIRLVLDDSDHSRWGWSRLAAATALGRIGDARALPALVARVCRAGEDKPSAHRLAWAAIEALSSMRSLRAVPLLVDALDTDDPLARYYLARALGATRDERAGAPLKLLLEDTTPVPAAGGTVAAGARRGLRRLRRYLRRHGEGKM